MPYLILSNLALKTAYYFQIYKLILNTLYYETTVSTIFILFLQTLYNQILLDNYITFKDLFIFFCLFSAFCVKFQLNCCWNIAIAVIGKTNRQNYFCLHLALRKSRVAKKLRFSLSNFANEVSTELHTVNQYSKCWYYKFESKW